MNERVLDFKAGQAVDELLHSSGFGVLVLLKALVENQTDPVAVAPTVAFAELIDSFTKAFGELVSVTT